MKQRISNWTKLLYGFLMTILGFSGCDAIEDIFIPKEEYGMPYAEFKVVGEVKSTEGKPIKGIRVIVNPRKDKSDDVAKWYQDTLYTDANGKFSKDRLDKYTWPETNLFKFTFEDLDGADNGGEFETVTLFDKDISVEQVKKGDGGWYEGDYIITANATLSPKKKD